MTKYFLIAALAASSLAPLAGVCDSTKAPPAEPRAEITEPAPVTENTTLFTRVNGTYRKTQKKLAPQT